MLVLGGTVLSDAAVHSGNKTKMLVQCFRLVRVECAGCVPWESVQAVSPSFVTGDARNSFGGEGT